ncbi:MAG: hypothetical protein WD317_00775, partial [Balneolaceae bacterium]
MVNKDVVLSLFSCGWQQDQLPRERPDLLVPERPFEEEERPGLTAGFGTGRLLLFTAGRRLLEELRWRFMLLPELFTLLRELRCRLMRPLPLSELFTLRELRWRLTLPLLLPELRCRLTLPLLLPELRC